ncbi:MAG: carbon starvation protein A [Halobacteriovoraceae bacterium]|nr:carbon starvation protein A [Halobacteriovoraceae bacterium]
MNASYIALGCLVLFALAYRFYARYISTKIFQLDLLNEEKTPALKYEDGIDFVPTRKEILIGHHFSSIAGAAPIVGPAVAAIWGWVPAILWIVFGVIFIGACHDFGTLFVSMKNNGKSIAEFTEGLLGLRTKYLFLIIIFFLVWMVIAVFTLVIANLFISYPASVIPINFEIIVAVLLGLYINHHKGDLKIPSILAQIGLIIMVFVGTKYPISLDPLFGQSSLMAWIIFLLIYSFIASVLPVWMLLQPRDFINSHQLFLGLGLLLVGLFVTSPTIVAPAINPNPVGAPPWFPFLFITIACGAISGFHGLVSGGTTSKQIQKWTDARPIGYGSMLGEGLLALIATLAVTAGFESKALWHNHYATWNAANGLSAKINAFVTGSSKFLNSIGISEDISQTFIAVLIISFAATSLDTACRIQRYIIAEFGDVTGVKVLKNRYIGSSIAVLSALFLMLTSDGGKGGLHLWPLFGATNQMLAGLSLIIISVYLYKNRRPCKSFLIPAFFILAMTFMSLVLNIQHYLNEKKFLLLVLGVFLTLSQLWIIIESFFLLKNLKNK